MPLEPQVFDLVQLFAENADRLVSKDELIEAVWGGRIVSEATVSSRINMARSAIGDTGKAQAILRTVPRRGFRLVAPVIAEAGGAVPTPAPARPVEGAMRQTIRYTTSPDGANVAWSSAGAGPPVLFGMHHLSHLELDWTSSLHGPVFRELAGRPRLIRDDIRGTGLSDPIRDGDTIDQYVADMIAVADAAGLERFAVIAILQSAAIAIRLAALHPERVSRLVLQNGCARRRARREGAADAPEHDPFIALLNSGGCGDPNNGFMRAWATMVLPEISPDEVRELIELIANADSTANALTQRDVIDNFDVTGDLGRVRCPTLIVHARRNFWRWTAPTPSASPATRPASRSSARRWNFWTQVERQARSGPERHGFRDGPARQSRRHSTLNFYAGMRRWHSALAGGGGR